MMGKISFGAPPIYSSSLKPKMGLLDFLDFVLASTLKKRISFILLFNVSLDGPLGGQFTAFLLFL
ncbi:hypothetical protein TSUD_54160 [Trifolium subterraneum]|uniref:Uncharacterized protein n=1 Tax=Trifolium subterraneum TaxID=3900 RepID=A0A2Z6N3Y7_TRISU|nr:hypothetical protein TSUD_54160 [Trifolium subterraneum]